jgi:hypothetical protein
MRKLFETFLIMAICAPLTIGLAQPLKMPAPPMKLKSENTAVLYSLLGTTGPLVITAAANGRSGIGALAFAGLILGPSTGYFYAEKPGRALTGIGIRLGATGLMVAGVAVAFVGAEDIFSENPNTSNADIGGALIIAGGVILVTDIVIDIALVGHAVGDHNREMQRKAISIAPSYNPKLKMAGLHLGLQF